MATDGMIDVVTLAEVERRISAALDAARPLIRRQAFNEAAAAIQSTKYYPYPPAVVLYERGRIDGLRKARDDAAALVRGLGETP